jgi:hypothetical protein
MTNLSRAEFKQRIASGVPFKLLVEDDSTSMQVQRVAFESGCEWSDGGCAIWRFMRYLVMDNGKLMHSGTLHYFTLHRFEEIFLNIVDGEWI